MLSFRDILRGCYSLYPPPPSLKLHQHQHSGCYPHHYQAHHQGNHQHRGGGRGAPAATAAAATAAEAGQDSSGASEGGHRPRDGSSRVGGWERGCGHQSANRPHRPGTHVAVHGCQAQLQLLLVDALGLQGGRVHALYEPVDACVLAWGEVEGHIVEGGTVICWGGLIHAAAGCRPPPVPPSVEDAWVGEWG